MGIAASAGKNNDELVDNLVQGKYIRFRSVELAMRLVDRGDYFPEDERENAYKDIAWKENDSFSGPIHLSAPCIYANALEYLDLQPGLSFLNVGSGSGYFSTVAGFLLTETGINHGVEVYENMVEYADTHLQKALGRPAASAFSFGAPVFFHGSAFFTKNNIQYDRIYCGALVPNQRRSFFANMLKINGILVCPYGNELIRVKRTGPRSFEVYSVSQVSFSNLIAPAETREFTKTSVVLPHFEPKSLQEICRSTVRKAIRDYIHDKHPLKLHFECDPGARSSGPRRDNNGLGAVFLIDGDQDEGSDHERENEAEREPEDVGNVNFDEMHERVRREMDETMEMFRDIQRRHENIRRRMNDDPPLQRIIALVQNGNERDERVRTERNNRLAAVGFVIADLDENGDDHEDTDRRRVPPAPLGYAFHDQEFPSEYEIMLNAPEIDNIDMSHILPSYAMSLITPASKRRKRKPSTSSVHRHRRVEGGGNGGIRLHTITYRGGRDRHRIEHVERLIHRLRETTVRRQRAFQARHNEIRRLRLRLNRRNDAATETPRENHHDVHDEDEPTSTARLGLNAGSTSSLKSERDKGTKRSAPDTFNDYDTNVKRSASDGNIQETSTREALRSSFSSPTSSTASVREDPVEEEATNTERPEAQTSSPTSSSSDDLSSDSNENESSDNVDKEDEEDEKLDKEREKRANEQNQSLETFHKHYLKYLSGLPVPERLIRFLMFDE